MRNDATAPRQRRNRRPILPALRFWRFVSKEEGDGCWLWTGGTQRYGYGAFWSGTAVVPAHRWLYEQTYGAIASGLYVCHRCDVPACVRPSHLFLETQAGNMQDASRKGRIGWNNPKGKNAGASNGQAKLTEDQVRAIRARHAAGERQASLAREYGITSGSMSLLINRKNWGHVSP